MLDMRLGNDSDIPFIMNLVRDGITSGAFFYFDGKGFETVKSELESVTRKYRDNIPIGDYLFVFDGTLKREPVGFALLTGRNDFAGRASHLEIRMFAVAADKQSKGIGKNMLTSIIEATPGHRLEASCLPPSIKMMKLLAGSGFKLINTTQGGKKTYRFVD
ncbi:GNAT family N-acetyltransferase [Salmonella enterica subsp. enterica serovar Infantis]|nr:GNAT family N-acetyltransferase [Salmonella enterica subsp. enterica serovar Infantis]EIT4164471.1 GNAT family N-acetyltransferase [Salmonella enterica subsp. enterica serovar Infantis]